MTSAFHAGGNAVSVALCTHNGERFIAAQLLSILNQTVPPAQIVISDDASTDATIAVIKQAYASAVSADPTLSRVELTILENPTPLGVTKNFEQAIKSCANELIALCDQDDEWLPRRLEVMTGEFERRADLTLLHHDSLLVDAEGRPLGLTTFEVLRMSRWEKQTIHEGRALSVLLRRNLVTGATAMFRRELAEKSTPFPESWVHDEWLGIIAAATGRVDFLDDCLVKYRQHGANQIGARKLGIKHAIGRILYARTQRNAQLLTRATALVTFAKKHKLPPRLLIIFGEKYEHEVIRSSYPETRIKRLMPVRKEIRTGRYSRCGLGNQDIIRDLLQSPK